MAMRSTRRHERVVLLGSVNPEYVQTVRTYASNLPTEIVVVPVENGAADLAAVEAAMDEKTACLVVQHPNFFGCLEDAAKLTEIAHRFGALSVVSFDPISLGVLKRPGDYGADIAVAEGQPLGIPLQYGGPLLGVMACREQFVRRMPGRIAGQTADRRGKRCWVLTLQTREQHIRRDKATSNICTNQGLLALRATVYLALVGPRGLREVATLCTQKAHYAAEQLTEIDGLDLLSDRPFFKEFTLRCEGGPERWIQKARSAGFDIGPDLKRFQNANLPKDGLLVAVTEKHTKADIDRLAEALRK
jgi:glycine dehydrogenase subunit 1